VDVNVFPLEVETLAESLLTDVSVEVVGVPVELVTVDVS
jgi:hypothetical protein